MMSDISKKIGIFGGTFDPVHKAHIRLAKQAMEELSLDEIWFVPAYHPPHKNYPITDFEIRFRLLERSIRAYPTFVCSDFEKYREGKSYTVDTLEQLVEMYPETRFYFIMGADSLFEFETWKRPERIVELADLIVASRAVSEEISRHIGIADKAKELEDKYTARIHILHLKEVDISSSRLRLLCKDFDANATEISLYIPKEIIDIIRDEKIYA